MIQYTHCMRRPSGCRMFVPIQLKMRERTSMRRKYERFRLRCKGLTRLWAALLAGLLLAASLFTTVMAQDIVRVTDSDGNSHTMLTTGLSPDEMLALASQVAGTHDEVQLTESSPGYTSLNILRAFPVSARADGNLYQADMVGGTVGDLLKKCAVRLEGEDYVEPALDTPLSEGLEVAVHRVSYEEETTRAEVEDAEVDLYLDKLLTEDPETPFRRSNSGIYTATYRHRLVDGKPQESELLALVPVITPRDPGSTAFTPGVPCSTIAEFEGVEMGIDGLPVNASRVIRGATTTAYSSSGGRGASGLGLYCGTVAVNPNVIPYGTRLFITTPDQSFVYGFAIATDTGIALMDGRVDIDLYFATNAECRRFGKRAMDVYILD